MSKHEQNDCIQFSGHVSGITGHDPAQPGESCKHILDSGFSVGDGEYWIDPGNLGNPFEVFCDMTTDGGNQWLLRPLHLKLK